MPLAPSRLAPLETDARASAVARPSRRPPRRAADPAAGGAGRRRPLPARHAHPRPARAPAGLAAARRWAAAAEAFLAQRGAQLSAEVRKSIVAETLAVLQRPGVRAAVRARAAAPRCRSPPRCRIRKGAGPALRLTGKIDRLVMTARQRLIVDYKTNRPPPGRSGAGCRRPICCSSPPIALAVQRIFPGMQVRAAILWTDGPRIMEIPRRRARRRASSGSGSCEAASLDA